MASSESTFGLQDGGQRGASITAVCQSVRVIDPTAEADFTILGCGIEEADEGDLEVGQTVKWNLNVQNNVTRIDGGIIGNAVWYFDGEEVARINDQEVGPDRDIWLSTRAPITVDPGDYTVEAAYEDVTFINP